MSDNCQGSIETALDILVGKWKPVILYQLAQHQTLRFSELQRLIPDITKKMLTSQLRELEYHGIVHREIYPVVPPKVEYSLTEYAATLTPLLLSMHEWGLNHLQYLEKLHGTAQGDDELKEASAAE